MFELLEAMARRSVESMLSCQSDEEPIPLVLTRPASTSSFVSGAESQRSAARLVEEYLSNLQLDTVSRPLLAVRVEMEHICA